MTFVLDFDPLIMFCFIFGFLLFVFSSGISKILIFQYIVISFIGIFTGHLFLFFKFFNRFLARNLLTRIIFWCLIISTTCISISMNGLAWFNNNDEFLFDLFQKFWRHYIVISFIVSLIYFACKGRIKNKTELFFIKIFIQLNGLFLIYFGTSSHESSILSIISIITINILKKLLGRLKW